MLLVVVYVSLKYSACCCVLVLCSPYGAHSYLRVVTCSYYRFPGRDTFLQVVPLPWLAVACFSTVELATNAYVVENENFRHLTQR